MHPYILFLSVPFYFLIGGGTMRARKGSYADKNGTVGQNPDVGLNKMEKKFCSRRRKMMSGTVGGGRMRKRKR